MAAPARSWMLLGAFGRLGALLAARGCSWALALLGGGAGGRGGPVGPWLWEDGVCCFFIVFVGRAPVIKYKPEVFNGFGLPVFVDNLALPVFAFLCGLWLAQAAPGCL